MKDITAAIDLLCPMNVVIDDQARIHHAGPAFAKLWDSPSKGQNFFDLMQVKRPKGPTTLELLDKHAGRKLHLQTKNAQKTDLKGVAMPLVSGSLGLPKGGALLNLSFGMSVIDAVSHYDLTASDFAHTDLTIEMLYLVEAKTAAMSASQSLNTRLQGAKIAAEEQAFTDTLTGLKNRRALDHVLPRLIDRRQDFALMNMDLDHFKSVNDTLGHAAGDHVLQQVARIMLDETRAEDTIIRTGGDEFVLIFANMVTPEKLSEIADRLIEKIEVPMPFNGETCKVSASIGATFSCWYQDPDLQELQDHADQALYAAKDAGRGCHVLYSEKLPRLTEADVSRR